jgi:hypothetical protein
MTNIISFPKAKKNSPPQSFEEMIESVEVVRKEHIEFIVDEAMSYLFARVYEEGFNLTSDKCTKSTALAVEAFRAALYNAANLEHPMHELAETMFCMDDLDIPDYQEDESEILE